MNHKEVAIKRFVEGYNCAQAVACSYAEELGLKEEMIFRLMEGFGGGLAHMGHTCGVISGLTMVESYRVCEDMSHMPDGKLMTYAHLQPKLQQFQDNIGSLNCHEILRTHDQTLIDGKKACCRTCVELACQILDETL